MKDAGLETSALNQSARGTTAQAFVSTAVTGNLRIGAMLESTQMVAGWGAGART